MKKQIILIHGGNAFNTYEEFLIDLRQQPFEYEAEEIKGWKDNLSTDLAGQYEVIYPEMPNWSNAKYVEWKIWFEKMIPLIRDGAIFIGHSLGGIFLSKYFAENDYRKEIGAIFLVAACYTTGSLGDFTLPTDFTRLKKLGAKVHLYHSKDDMVVPFSDMEGYMKTLPEAQTRIFTDRGHFRQPTFPEIIEDIKKVVSTTN